MLTTPPFRRAPGLLIRRPAVLFSVIGTATILSLVAAMTPLFLSSASSAALLRELEGRCPASFAGTTTLFGTLEGRHPESMTELVEENREILRDHVPTHAVLGEAEVILRGTVVNLTTGGGGPPLTGRFLARDNFRDHIVLVEGTHGPGAYVDDVLAEQLGVAPGDTFSFTAGSGTSQVEVQAVYAGLYAEAGGPYWCSVQDVLETNAMGDLPPPPILVDPDYFGADADLTRSVYANYGSAAGTWEIPVILDGLTVTQSREVAEVLAEIDEVVVSTELTSDVFQTNPGVHSDLPMVTQRVQALTDALASSILPLAAVVLIAAIALIGGAGSYWVDRRNTELQYLYAIGAGPGQIALKAGLEFFPAMVAGSAIGWAAANLSIGFLGPSSSVEPASRLTAIWVTAAATTLGIVSVAVVVGIRARGLLDHRTRHRGRFPWRLPLLLVATGAAVWVRAGIGASAVTIEENQLVGSVDPLVLLFPLFTFLAVVLIIAEAVIRSSPLLKRLGAKSHAMYLASRRIVSGRTLVIALIAGSALPVATLIYAASLTRSATSTIDAKGRGFIGADISTPVFDVIDPPGDIAEVSTVVIKTERAELNGARVDVLAVDKDTFARGAFWDDSYSGVPLDEILTTLSGDAVGGPLPAYVANGPAEDGQLESRAGEAQIVVVGEVEAFPGGRGSRPLIIVDRQRYLQVVGDEEGRVGGSRYLMWTTGRTEDEVEAAMAAADLGYAFTVAAETTLDQLKFAAVVWTFDFLEIYAGLAGFIAIGGMLLYVDTRQRQRNLSYALARRMGLTRAEHLRAGFIELAGLTVIGALAGILAASIAARSLYAVLDAVPETPPGPRWIGALDLSLLAILIALGVAAAAASLAQRTADGADTSELLRHGD